MITHDFSEIKVHFSVNACSSQEDIKKNLNTVTIINRNISKGNFSVC